MSNTKWPKAWIEAVHCIANDWSGNYQRAIAILDSLRVVGALKEPPKPREWWVCETCHQICSNKCEHGSPGSFRTFEGIYTNKCDARKWTLIREVVGDE